MSDRSFSTEQTLLRDGRGEARRKAKASEWQRRPERVAREWGREGE